MKDLELYTLEELLKDKKAYVQMAEKSKALGYETLYAYMEKEEGIVTNDDTNEKVEKLKKEIREYFQGDSIEARDIYAKNLYYRIRKACRQRGITVREFITELGYRYDRVATQVSRFDYDTLRRIHREYMPNQSDISRLFGVSRQLVNNIIKNNVNEAFTGDSWLQTSLDAEQEELILEMLIGREYERIEDELSVNIICDGKGKLLFVFKIGDSIKVLFDEHIPKDIHELLDEVGMSKLFSEERLFLDKCSFAHILDKRVILENKQINKNKWDTFKKNFYKKRALEEKAACPEIEIYGFINKRDFSYEKIIEILSEAADEDNGVVTTNKYVTAVNRHFRHFRFDHTDSIFDYSQIEEFDAFLNFHGFHLKGHHAHTEETKQKRRAMTDEKYRNLLREYIIAPGTNMVSFSSYDPLYGAIFQTAMHRGMNIASYVDFLGYEFISSRERNSAADDVDIFDDDESMKK